MRILIVSLKSQTEALWSAALASAMKRLLPKVRIDFLTLQANQETIEGIEAVDRVLALAPNEALLPKTLRGMRRSWDWAIAVQGDPRSVLLTKHLARRQTSPVGGLGLRSLWGRLIVSDAAEAESGAPFDRMSSLLAPIAGRAVQPNEVVPVHPAAQSVSEALEGKIRGRRFVLFLTRPRLPLLAWPEDHWRRLASHAARKGLLVVWAEPQPEDESGVSPREPRCESLSALAGALSLGQIVELARRAAVCVGVDSVEFQAATAAGAHALALFGPSLPSSWGPVPIRGPRQWSNDEAVERLDRIIVARSEKFLDCDACDGARSCGLHPCHDQALCMHELSAEDAARELDRMTDDGGAASAV